jgi:glycosyltransferase involved in cell wall biosynthesis
MLDDQDITFICDPLLSEYGPLRPAILLAKKFMDSSKRITMVSTIISPELQRKLDSMRIQTVNLKKGPILKKNESMAWMEEWLREASFSINSKGISTLDGVILNFSNTLAFPAHVWYAQGPPTVTLDNMKSNLPLQYKVVYQSLSRILKTLDMRFTRKIAYCSTCVVANSKYLASVYRRFAVRAEHVIYPPLDCEQFRPMSTTPSEDFVLTYFGKETIFELVEQILDKGVKIKAFGGKLSLIPKRIHAHKNLEFLGRIENEKLIELYSDALFTFYPFTDEPFGYIPLESLACGTPVVTFGKQGPKETILHGETGWLANTNSELSKLALKLWNDGYPTNVRRECRQSAVRFDIKAIADEWLELLSSINP